MTYLHAHQPRPVLHNDLKSANTMIDASFRAKIADFGLSSKRFVQGVAGTPFWMAPELLNGARNSKASDVYAFAILLAEVAKCDDPYAGCEDEIELLKGIADVHREIPVRPELPASTPTALQDICSRAWAPHPDQRPTFPELAVMLKSAVMISPLGGPWRTSKGRTGVASAEMQAELARQRELLLRVFPAKVAQALMEGRTVEPQSLDCVTIFFSDIVGFTGALPSDTVHLPCGSVPPTREMC